MVRDRIIDSRMKIKTVCKREYGGPKDEVCMCRGGEGGKGDLSPSVATPISLTSYQFSIRSTP